MQKNDKAFFAIFGKTVGHKGLKFCTGSFLTWVYNFVSMKIFVGGCLDNNRKMLITITTTRARARTSQSSPRPARLDMVCRLWNGEKKRSRFFFAFFYRVAYFEYKRAHFWRWGKIGTFWSWGLALPQLPIRRKAKNPTSQGERATKSLVELSLPEQDGGKWRWVRAVAFWQICTN